MRIALLSVLLVLACLVTAKKYRQWNHEEQVCTRTLVNWGYTSVKLGNEIENLCGDGLYSVSFKAIDKKGRRVHGGICCETN